MTIREALAKAGAELKNAKIKTHSLDAQVLLADTLSRRHRGTEGGKIYSRADLAAMCNEVLTEEEQSAFEALKNRRKNGECVAYITGKKEFWGMEFLVNKAVLVPRPETETLVEIAIKTVKGPGTGDRGPGIGEKKAESKIRILDLCTGSGAIAIALKNELPEAQIYATDISAEALETAKKNANRLLQNTNNFSFYRGDLYDALSAPHSPLPTPLCSDAAPPVPRPLFTLIVSNPPYIKSSYIETLPPEVKNEPRLALNGGETGLDIITRIIKGAPKHLQGGGGLLLEADPMQMEEIASLLEKSGFKGIELFKDLAGLNRVIGGKFA